MAKKTAPPPAQAFTPRDVSLGLTRAEDVAFPLRWGIIGTGEISRQFVSAACECPGATIAAVSSRSADNAHAFAEAHGVEKAYDTYEDMVAAPDIDVVYVGTPGDVHKEHSLIAIEAGKHVLCEKELTHSVADAEEMYAAAERHNVMLQDGVWTRFFPAVEHARHLIEEGAIGDVAMVQSAFAVVYTLQAVTLAYGDAKPTNIQVAGKNGGAGGAMLEFENDRFAFVTFVAFRTEFPEITEFIGTKGRITLEEPGHCPTALTVRIPPVTPSRYMNGNTPSPLQRFEYPLPDSIRMPRPFPNQQGFIYMVEAIHRCLAAGLRECPQFNKAESLHLLEIIGEINNLRAANADMDL
jgi:dihydrodiol dehydrogenase / D-xylose 1-dehydrogenase (NADP)